MKKFNNLEVLNNYLKKLDDRAKQFNKLNLINIIVNGLFIQAPMGCLNIRDWGNKNFKEISWEISGYNGVFKDKYLFDVNIYINY